MRRLPGLNIWEIVLLVGVLVAATIYFMLPTLGRAKDGRRVGCGTHLKTQGSAFAIYAASYSENLPGSNVKLSSMCEQSIGARDAIVSAGQLPLASGTGFPKSADQKWFYCPFNAAQDPGKLWGSGGVSTWGYVWMNDRGAVAGLPTAFPGRTVPLEYVSNLNTGGLTAETILALDVVVTDRDTGPLDYMPKGVAVGFGSNHVKSGRPSGVNVLRVDGSVTWETFDEKTAVAVRQPGGGYFWFPGP